LTLAPGVSATCTINNDDHAGGLALVKKVVNDGGSTAVATDWTLTATGPTPLSGAGGVAATPVAIGDYTLAETGGPADYSAGNWSCSGGILKGNVVTVALDAAVTCTIINDDVSGTLTLREIVVNDNNGTSVPPDWVLNAAGPTALSGVTGSTTVTTVAVGVGSYVLSETGPQGYTGTWSCRGGVFTSGNTIEVAVNDAAVCTLVNDDLDTGLSLVTTAAPIPSLRWQGLLALILLMPMVVGWNMRRSSVK
jgi:hypothetical protein